MSQVTQARIGRLMMEVGIAQWLQSWSFLVEQKHVKMDCRVGGWKLTSCTSAWLSAALN